MKDISVLYVEDHAPSRTIIRMVLTNRMGLARVTILEDSTGFMSKVQAACPKYDLVLLDIHVKPHDGFEMLEMLRSLPDYSQTPIVALTASVMNEEVNRLEAAGFHSVVSKPVDIDQFPQLLERILRGERIWTIVE